MELPQTGLPAGPVSLNTEGNTSYRSGRLWGSGFDSTALLLQVPSDDAPDWAGYSTLFTLTCAVAGRTAVIWGVGLANSVAIAGEMVSVTHAVNGGPGVAGTWDVWPWGSWYAISPRNDEAFYQPILGSDTLTITVASDPEYTETYDLKGNGFWTTPVQPNLDACGSSWPSYHGG